MLEGVGRERLRGRVIGWWCIAVIHNSPSTNDCYVGIGMFLGVPKLVFDVVLNPLTLETETRGQAGDVSSSREQLG